MNAFGVFQAYYAQNQLKDHSASAISWIGSIQLGLTYIFGLFLGRAFDLYGSRVCSVFLALNNIKPNILLETSYSRMVTLNFLSYDAFSVKNILSDIPLTEQSRTHSNDTKQHSAVAVCNRVSTGLTCMSRW